MAKYKYTIFDADPSSSSGAEWPSHSDVEIEADDDAEAIETVRDVLEVEAAGLSTSDGYDVGDTLYSLIWSVIPETETHYAYDVPVSGAPTYVLTADDLGEAA